MKQQLQLVSALIVSTLLLVSCKKAPEIAENTNKKILPTVETGIIENITINSATINCKIILDGNSLILTRGVCYDTISNPSLENLFTLNGEGVGEFTSELENLLEGTHYYVKAYATNEVGTAYGAQVEFNTTSIDFPVITTLDPSDITMNSAIVGGDIISAGISEIISKGVCWSLDDAPTIENSIDFSNEGSGSGAFSSQINDLLAETTYYAAAYAQNSKGVSYGSVVSFTTKKANATNFTSIYTEDVTCNSAILKAEVDTIGNFNIISSGFCWNTNYNVDLINNSGVYNTNSFTENINYEITGLESVVTYYFKAFVQLENDTTYSSLSSFTTCMGNLVIVDSINEHFDMVSDYQDVEIEGWTNITVQGNRKWWGKTFNEEKWATAQAYNSGLDYMETWLITPIVTNISEKVLSFKSAMAYWEHTSNTPMTILISTDFMGNNFETATWEELSCNLPTISDDEYAFIESGEVDLSSYSGNAVIAFKYIGSNAESTSIMIDDVLIGFSGIGGGSATYSEPFTTSLGSYTGYSKIGDQVWEWSFYDGGCAKMDGYSGSSFANEDWLISPNYDLSNNLNTVMNVRQTAGYINDDWSQIKILISANYAGSGDPTLATWVEVIAPNMPTGSDFIFVDSGDIDLSDWDGEVIHVAFKYLSTVASSSTWEISSVEVK